MVPKRRTEYRTDVLALTRSMRTQGDLGPEGRTGAVERVEVEKTNSETVELEVRGTNRPARDSQIRCPSYKRDGASTDKTRESTFVLQIYLRTKYK